MIDKASQRVSSIDVLRISATLGVICVYAAHYLFVDLLAPLSTHLRSACWEVGKVAVVYALSLGLTLLLRRVRFLRAAVT